MLVEFSSHAVDKSPYAYCDQYKQQSYAYMVDFNFCEAYVLLFMCTLFCYCVVVTICSACMYVCMYSSGKEE